MTVRNILLLCALALVALALAPYVTAWWSQPAAAFLGRRSQWWDAEDFAVFHTAGRLIASGQGHLLYTPSAFAGSEHRLLPTHEGVVLNYYNPAFFALLFAPLSRISFDRAFQIWTLLNLCVLAVVCRMTCSIAAPMERRWRFLVIAALVSLYPVTFALRLGQFSLILLAAWLAAFLLLRAGRDRAAGAALAVLLIKPELLIPAGLYLVIKRRPAAFATLLPLTFAAIILSVTIVGLSEATRYPAYIRQSAFDGTGNMYGWNGILGASLSPDNPGNMMAAGAFLGLLTLGSMAVAWWRESNGGNACFAREWTLLTLGAMLADGHFYLQDTVLLVPGAVALIASVHGRERAAVLIAAAIGWAILGLGNEPSQNWHVNIFGWYAVLATGALIVRQVVATRVMPRAVAQQTFERTRAA